MVWACQTRPEQSEIHKVFVFWSSMRVIFWSVTVNWGGEKSSQMKLLRNFCQAKLIVSVTLSSRDSPGIKGKSTGQIKCSLFHNEMFDHKDVYLHLNIKQPRAEYFPRLMERSGFYERNLWKNVFIEIFSMSFQVCINHGIQRLTLKREDFCVGRKTLFRSCEENN